MKETVPSVRLKFMPPAGASAPFILAAAGALAMGLLTLGLMLPGKALSTAALASRRNLGMSATATEMSCAVDGPSARSASGGSVTRMERGDSR